MLVLAWLRQLGSNYVTKLTYSRDKDVVFAMRPGILKDWESVYETHHLEQTLPTPIGAFQTMGQNAKDGIYDITCMNTKEQITVYNDDKYWNHDERDEFMAQTRTLWGDQPGPYQGRIFASTNMLTHEEEIIQQRVAKELEAAVQKLGKASPPKMPEEIF